MIVSVCAPNLAQSRAKPRILEDLVLVFLYTLLNRHVDGRFHILDRVKWMIDLVTGGV